MNVKKIHKELSEVFQEKENVYSKMKIELNQI